MPNEFKIKNGFLAEGNSQITGSLTVTGGITGSLQGTATTASFVTASNVVGTVTSASFARSASFANFATNAGYANNAGLASDASSIASAITNNGDNYLLTATGTGTIQGESQLTYDGTTLTALGTFIQGEGGSATGTDSHVEGHKNNSAIGDGSHAEGENTQANGPYSHAEGSGTVAEGPYSHAEGSGTVAEGDSSHAEGESTQANGRFSHAEGRGAISNGDNSHAEGEDSTAYGQSSHAEGDRASTGFYGYLATISNGTASIDASYGDVRELFTTWPSSGGDVKLLYIDDRVSSGYDGIYGVQQVAPTYGVNPPIFDGTNTIVYLADPYLTTTTAIIGFGNQNQPRAETLTPAGANYLVIGTSDHAEGRTTAAVGGDSHAEGVTSLASGRQSHAEGEGSQAIGNYAHSEGTQTKAVGVSSHAEGQSTQAIGVASHAEGYGSVSGYYGYLSNGGVSSGVLLISFSPYGDLTPYFTAGTIIIIQDSTAQPYGKANLYEVASSSYTPALPTPGTTITLVDTSVNTIGNVKVGLYIDNIRGIASLQPPKSQPIIGLSSHTKGYFTQAIGDFSHAEGFATVALGTNQFVVGQGNIPVSTNSSFIIGNGTYSTGSGTWTNKSNLLVAGGNTVQITGSLDVSGSITINSGSITMPNRPAFRVTGAGGGKTAVTTLSGSYLNVDYQQGSGWNNATGTFTAPIAGLYQVNVVVRTNSNSLGTISQLIVYKNYTGLGSGTPQIMVEFGANTTMNHTGGSTISKLDVGDTLTMVVAVGQISFDQNDNFSVAYIG
jgi:hypothetical protein